MKIFYLRTFYFLLLLLMTFLWLFSTSKESKIVFLIVLLFLLTIIPYLIENEIKLYNPIFIISGYIFITYGFGSLLTLIYPELDEFNMGLDGIIDVFYFSIPAFILFLIGFYLFKLRFFRNIESRIINVLPTVNKYEINTSKLFYLSSLFLIIGWLSRIYWFTSGAYYHSLNTSEVITITVNPLLRQFLVIMVTFPLVLALIYIYLYVENKEKKYFITGITFLILEFAYWLPSGSKEQLFIPLFLSLILVSFKERIPLKYLGAVITATVFIIFPFMNLYRLQKIGNLNYTFYLFTDMYGRFNFSTFEEIIKFVFGIRLNYAKILAIVIAKTEYVWGYIGGITYTDFFTQLIPRFIWPNKPPIEIGKTFGRDFGIISPMDYETSVGITWLGEMFLNFGWYGIVIAFFIGMLFKFFYDYFFSKQKPNLLFSILYVIIFYNLIKLEGTFVAQLSGIIKICFLYIIVLLPFLKISKLKTQ